jgi:hypothetical protein
MRQGKKEVTSKKILIDTPFLFKTDLAQNSAPEMSAESKPRKTKTLSIQNETPPKDEEVESVNLYKNNYQQAPSQKKNNEAGYDPANEEDGASLEALQNYRDDRTKSIELIESPIKSKRKTKSLEKQFNEMNQNIGGFTERLTKVVNEAGKDSQMPPFVLSMLGVLVVSVVLLKLNKKFILNFGARWFVRLLIGFLALTATLLFGGIFFGERFEFWIRALFNL